MHSRDQPSPETVDSSSIHDDDVEKNVATTHNLRLKKQQFCTLCTCDFHFRIFHSRSSVINKVKHDQLCSCVDDVSKWWQFFSFPSLSPSLWYQINSDLQDNKCTFCSPYDLEKWRNESYIFRWRHRFHRRKLPKNRCQQRWHDNINKTN